MSVGLTEDERRFLRAGLAQWGGPARPSPELAVAPGFADVPGLMTESRRLSILDLSGYEKSRLLNPLAPTLKLMTKSGNELQALAEDMFQEKLGREPTAVESADFRRSKSTAGSFIKRKAPSAQPGAGPAGDLRWLDNHGADDWQAQAVSRRRDLPSEAVGSRGLPKAVVGGGAAPSNRIFVSTLIEYRRLSDLLVDESALSSLDACAAPTEPDRASCGSRS
jgi:hypothetical protein